VITPFQGITAGLLLGFLVGSGGAWYVQGLRSETAIAAQADTFDAAVAKAKQEGIDEEHARAVAVAKTAEQGRKDLEKVEVNAAVSTGSTVSLSNAATSYAAASSCDTGVARRGASATRAAMVLSELLGESNRRASQLAKTADDARTRGLTCERAYNDLTPQGRSR